MDYFGINSPEDLPKIKEVLADQFVLPTHVSEALQQSEVEVEPESADPIIEETDPGAGEES
jgi:segregation and condensation protein B